eukprot:5552342-Pyramimonas_sp.AAC.1
MQEAPNRLFQRAARQGRSPSGATQEVAWLAGSARPGGVPPPPSWLSKGRGWGVVAAVTRDDVCFRADVSGGAEDALA